MAATYDSVGAGDTSSPFSWTHTPVGTIDYVIVYAMTQGSSAPSTQTYGGVATTPFYSTGISGGAYYAHLWYLNSSVPQGAQTVVVSGGATIERCNSLAFRLCAPQAPTCAITAGASGGSATATFTCGLNRSSDICVNFTWGDPNAGVANNITYTTGQTEVWDSGNLNHGSSLAYQQLAGSNPAFTATADNATSWALGALRIPGLAAGDQVMWWW